MTCSSSPSDPSPCLLSPAHNWCIYKAAPALGKGPHPSWLCIRLPFALSTVELGGQLEAGGTQELPNLVGACRQAVEPQETCQTEGRCSLRLCQNRARVPEEPWRGPGTVLAAGSPLPDPPRRPHRRVQLQWKRGVWALLSRWNLVSWGLIWCSHWSRWRRLRQTRWAPGGRCGS